jgi:DNA invertase Pin-like site-specific DNA recombinase
MSSLLLSNTTESRSEKIDERHLDQIAMVYVRQSSMQQVHRNQESTKMQYSLVGLAHKLGWATDRVVVIDDDLGVSGASAVGREGFQRLLAEVALAHVGIILGVEMSRLARSNKDWHQLLELCARFGTLIADLDGLYDPSRYNDRLLLGLKGTMSEAELHILRQRLFQGKLHKARRGELSMPVPTGYQRLPSGEVTLDPDDEVQTNIRLVFEEFERIGTVHGLLRSLANKGVQIGVRRRTRVDLGKLVWHRPHRGMVINILQNPIYAGAYAYGRRRVDPRRQQPGRPATGRTWALPLEQWHVCLQNRHPAYISWEQYQHNQVKLRENRERAAFSAHRAGSALLGGLITCGRCGYRMSVQYTKASNGHRYSRYTCNQASANRGLETCCGLSGSRLDEVVSELTLDGLKPAALELSMRVGEQLERDREKKESLWQKRIQRSRYEVERAERQYHAVEPENRLVARTLERAWEEKLKADRALQEDSRRRQEQEPRRLTKEEREMIRRLAFDLPTLWEAPSTTVADRKAILRILIDRVIATVNADSEWVDLTIRWAGGHETSTRMRRPVGKLIEMSTHKELLERMRALRSDGHTAEQIAQRLNDEGWVTPTQRNSFNERLVRVMLHRYGSVPRGPKRPPSDKSDECWLSDLADDLEMPVVTLYGWLRRGWLKARHVRGQWAVLATAQERRRLRRLRDKHPNRRPVHSTK